MTRRMLPIPISAGKTIADSYGYDQVVIIARRVGEDPQPRGEHVTTYGRDPGHCKVAARMGDFIKHKVMQWQEPAAEAAPADADLWYLQDTRSYVGNDVLWWAAAGGYTTDVSKAEAFTRDDAFRQAAMRGTDRAWPKAYIDGKTRPAVDMQYLDHEKAVDRASGQGGQPDA